MKKITINPHHCSIEELAKLKKYLTKESWDWTEESRIEDQPDTKTSKISRIEEIIAEWGETTVAELQSESSPLISNSGSNKNRTVVLVEEFYWGYVHVVTYLNECEIGEDDIPYEDLEEDVIDEILYLLENYDVDNYKTWQRC
jgi:hypothetical protein